MDSQLRYSWKALQISWENTKKVWIDSVRVGFENRYWNILEHHTVRTLDSLEILSGEMRNVGT